MPTNLGYYVLFGLCAVGAVATFFVSRKRLPLKLQRFKDRERLSIGQIHKKFYPDYEMKKFVEVWMEIAFAVEVPPELLRPTDRFDSELGPVKGFEIASETDDLEEAIIRRCRERHLDFSKLEIKTVDDYIKIFMAPNQAAAQ
jgi:hypothetical protein